MAFPDRIERTVRLDRPPAAVWPALTTPDGLAAWFGDEVEIDLRPGGMFRMWWADGSSTDMRVERIEEPVVFAFTWHLHELADDDPRRTYVEFTLEPDGAGTRLTVVETGFAQLSDDVHAKAYDSHLGGWAHELGELVGHVHAG